MNTLQKLKLLMTNNVVRMATIPTVSQLTPNEEEDHRALGTDIKPAKPAINPPKVELLPRPKTNLKKFTTNLNYILRRGKNRIAAVGEKVKGITGKIGKIAEKAGQFGDVLTSGYKAAKYAAGGGFYSGAKRSVRNNAFRNKFFNSLGARGYNVDGYVNPTLNPNIQSVVNANPGTRTGKPRKNYRPSMRQLQNQHRTSPLDNFTSSAQKFLNGSPLNH